MLGTCGSIAVDVPSPHTSICTGPEDVWNVPVLVTQEGGVASCWLLLSCVPPKAMEGVDV